MSEKPIYVYDKKLLADLRQKLPHLDIRAPDGHEPSLVFARVDSVEQITLPYRRDAPEPVGPEMVYQVGLVKWAYEQLETGRGLTTVLSHVSGIDPRKGFIYRNLEVGTVVGSYQAEIYDGKLHGNYVSPDNGVTMDRLGIPPDWAMAKNYYAQFQVTKEHGVLETTAAPFRGTKGGARQFFLTDLEHRNNYQPCVIGSRR